MEFDELERVAFGQLHLTPDEFGDMTLREWDNAMRGLEFSRQLESSNYRAIYTVLWNANRGKTPAKSESQLWPLPLIDGSKPGSVLNTREGKLELIKQRGYKGAEILNDEELKWFWKHAIFGSFGFDEKEVKANKRKVDKFIKEKGIVNSKG